MLVGHLVKRSGTSVSIGWVAAANGFLVDISSFITAWPLDSSWLTFNFALLDDTHSFFHIGSPATKAHANPVPIFPQSKPWRYTLTDSPECRWWAINCSQAMNLSVEKTNHNAFFISATSDFSFLTELLIHGEGPSTHVRMCSALFITYILQTRSAISNHSNIGRLIAVLLNVGISLMPNDLSAISKSPKIACIIYFHKV